MNIEGYHELVEKMRRETLAPTNIKGLISKLLYCKSALRTSSKLNVRNNVIKIKELIDRLEKIQNTIAADHNMEEEK